EARRLRKGRRGDSDRMRARAPREADRRRRAAGRPPALRPARLRPRARLRLMARVSPLGALGRGLAAGVAGTAAMTSYQLAVAKVRGLPLTTQVPRRWADAPAP